MIKCKHEALWGPTLTFILEVFCGWTVQGLFWERIQQKLESEKFILIVVETLSWN